MDEWWTVNDHCSTLHASVYTLSTQVVLLCEMISDTPFCMYCSKRNDSFVEKFALKAFTLVMLGWILNGCCNQPKAN